MHKNFHEQITRSALETRFSSRALKAIIAANLGQDSLLNLLKGHYHFDANGFEAAFKYIAQLDEDIDRAIEAGNYADAWTFFGRKTHAVQDFYAHTNYVALWLDAHPGYKLQEGSEVPPLEPAVLQSDRLFAARVYYPLEALTLFSFFVPPLKRILPPDAHVNMNLDSPDSGPLFPLAVSAAKQRTVLTCEDAGKRITGKFGAPEWKNFLDTSTDETL